MTLLSVLMPAVVAAVASIAVTWLTGRASRAATRKSAEVAEKVAGVDGLDRLTKALETRLARVETEAEECRAENRRLSERVDALEAQATEDTRLIEALRRYVRTLRDHILAADPAATIPPAPAGLHIDD